MARPIERTELRFLISQRVPNGSPGLCTLTLASTRIDPSSILASDAPTATRIARSSVTYWRACSAVRMSGRPTISTSGTPARLKSISEASLPWMRPPAPPTCVDLPVSSSRWARSMPRRVPSGRSSQPSTFSGTSYWLIWYALGMSG